jgi:uncharacterized transporter YbjL
MKEAQNVFEILKPYFSLGTLIAVIGFIIYMSRWVEHVENNVENNAKEILKHASDKVVHMPLQEKIDLFVPRTEIDGRLRNIENSLIEIKADLKKNFDK